MLRWLALLTVVVAVAGCGDPDTSAEVASGSSSSSGPSATDAPLTREAWIAAVDDVCASVQAEMAQLDPDGDFLVYLDEHASLVETFASDVAALPAPEGMTGEVDEFTGALERQAEIDRRTAEALAEGEEPPDPVTDPLPDLGLSCGV